MKPRSAKAKGTRLEVEIAKAFRDAGLDKKASRMPLSGAISGFKSDIHTSLPFIIEAKNQETWSPLAYMDQAQRDSDLTGKMPVVVMSKNRLPQPMVMMKFEDWILILQRAFIENKLPITTGLNSYSKHKQLKKG
jgi:hypothetical protein